MVLLVCFCTLLIKEFLLYLQCIMESKKAIIVGAGIAGLATAIRLRSQQLEVAVYEANSYPGGKLTAFETEGYRFDCGPSLFTMPQLVASLFEVAGKEMAPYFQYRKKEVVCHYFYEDGTRFTAHADTARFAKEAARVFGEDEMQLLQYFRKSKTKYDATATLFLEKSLHKLTTYLSIDTLQAIAQLHQLDIHTNLHSYNAASFNNPKLIQFFDRFATYNGSSPYKTPGIMSMIPHLEHHYGTYFPIGGMHSITQALYQLAQDIGVQFYFESPVTRIEVAAKKVIGVVVHDTLHPADLVVSNMDIVPTYRQLLPEQPAPEKTLSQPRSSSALIFYWGIAHRFPALELHNIFFSASYKKEFEAIFDQQTVIDDPTVYVNITSKEAPEDAPEGCENWFVMINVPADQGQDWDAIIAKARTNIIRKLSRILGTDIAPLIATEAILDPRAIAQRTQSYQGALYGSSSNNKFAAFLRHPNFSKKIKNLYFCGGSVHPGGGIPLCLLSGNIVSDMIQKEHTSHATKA